MSDQDNLILPTPSSDIQAVTSSSKSALPVTKEFKIYRILHTFALAGTWFGLGIYFNLVGPTLIDLKDLVHTDYDGVSKCLVARSIGVMVGTILGGFICGRYKHHIDTIVGTSLLVLGAALAGVPFSPNLGVLSVLLGVTGASLGVASTGGNPFAVLLWGEKSSAVLHALSFARSAGDVLGPIVAKPFLSYNITVLNASLINSTNMVKGLSWSLNNRTWLNEVIGDIDTSVKGEESAQNLFTTQVPPRNYTTTPTQIEYPYLMAAGTLGAVGLFFLFLSCIKVPFELVAMRSKTKATIRELLRLGSCTGGDVALSVQLLLHIFTFFMLLIGTLSVSIYITAMAFESNLHFPKPVAANIAIAYMGSIVAGLFISIAISHFCPVQIMIFAELTLVISVLTVYSFLGFKTKLSFWICSCVFGFFNAPLTATSIAWVSRYMTFTAMVMVVIDLGRATGGFISSWAYGYFLQYFGAQYIAYGALVSTIAMLLLTTSMQLIVSCNGKCGTSARQRVDQNCININE